MRSPFSMAGGSDITPPRQLPLSFCVSREEPHDLRRCNIVLDGFAVRELAALLATCKDRKRGTKASEKPLIGANCHILPNLAARSAGGSRLHYGDFLERKQSVTALNNT
jgi:hypothetical protein